MYNIVLCVHWTFQNWWDPSTCNSRQQHIGGYGRGRIYAMTRSEPKRCAAFLISSATMPTITKQIYRGTMLGKM